MTYSETQTSFSQAAAAEFDTGDQSPHLQEPQPAPKVEAKQPELFVPLTGRAMPDFSKKRRALYPFDSLNVNECFPAGKADKALMNRLYVAVSARKKKQPAEGYNFERAADGIVYVWRTA